MSTDTRPYAQTPTADLVEMITADWNAMSDLVDVGIWDLAENVMDMVDELTARHEATAGNTYVVDLIPYSMGDDHWVDNNSADAINSNNWTAYLMEYCRYTKCGVSFQILYVGPEGKARRVHGGPILPGPYAALVPKATVLSAHPMLRPDRIVTLVDGDTLVLNGQEMRVIDDRLYHYPALVTPEEFAVRDAARKD